MRRVAILISTIALLFSGTATVADDQEEPKPRGSKVKDVVREASSDQSTSKAEIDFVEVAGGGDTAAAKKKAKKKAAKKSKAKKKAARKKAKKKAKRAGSEADDKAPGIEHEDIG